jgi:hypothetical protein
MNGKKKLMVVLGAGASVELGMPSVSGIDTLFHAWAGSDTALGTYHSPNIYGFIRDQINCYYSNNRNPLRETNYEEVLYMIFLLSSTLDDNSFIFPMNAFLTLNDFPLIRSLNGERSVNRGDLTELVSLLEDRLINEFRRRCVNRESDSSGHFNLFRNFINQLRQDFVVAFISINYDNLVTQASPELFTGFDPETGFFHPERVHERSDWDLIYQIHGSVHFDMQGANHDMHGIRWNRDLSGRFSQNSSGRNFQYMPEGIPLPTSVIVAGYGKSLQIQRLPFRTYYSQLDIMAQQSDAFLFIGYGFGDLHLNKCFHDIRRGPVARPVVVITYSNDNEDAMDTWYRNLWTAVPYNGFEMGRRNHSATPFIAQLIQDRELEVSTNPSYPLAIWHGGFMDACNHYDLIKDELNL